MSKITIYVDEQEMDDLYVTNVLEGVLKHMRQVGLMPGWVIGGHNVHLDNKYRTNVDINYSVKWEKVPDDEPGGGVARQRVATVKVLRINKSNKVEGVV